MTPKQLERARELFAEAITRAPEDRATFLDHECEASLRAEVESLLAGERDASPGSAATGRGMTPEEAQAVVGERYRIEHLAGAGGMGRVFAATDAVLQRRVAIKIMDRLPKEAAADQAASDAQEQSHMLGEARAMAGLQHPNLCRVHDLPVSGPRPFIVMDWIDGVDLSTAWRDFGLSRRLSLFVKIIDAVAAVHGAGLVHGDLKPGNVLVDRSGEPILVDFGLACSASDNRGKRAFGGTPGYAAPEQFDEAAPMGPTADVYALGAMMYQMLTDRLPFREPSLAALLRVIREEHPPLPESHAPDTPWPLQRICLQALESDPARRYPDAQAMRADLRRYLKGENIAARPSMLADRFTERVAHGLQEVDSWLRQGMVTEPEANQLRRVLSRLLRPESHWIIDSRRLTWPQITLYVGGWFVLVALSVGMFLTWDAFDGWPSVRYAAPWAVFFALLSAGIAMQKRGERRASLGYLITAALLLPVAVCLFHREVGWLGTPMATTVQVPSGNDQPWDMRVSQEWLDVFFGLPGEDGLMNRQMLVMMFSWLGISIWLRRFTSSGAFSLFAVVAAEFGSVMLVASAGLLLPDDRHRFGLLGLWMLAVGAAGLWPGLRLNSREEASVRLHGRMRAGRHDSWPILTGSLVMILIGLTLMARNVPDIYTGGLLEYEDPDGDGASTTTAAVAFILNGAVLQAVSHLLSRQPTIVRSRLAELIRWVSPSHILGGILALEIDAEGGAWLGWLLVLGVSSVMLCYVAAWKQWRPFLFTGLFYVAIAYARAFYEASEQLGDDPGALDTTRVALTASLLTLGILAMMVAWKLPDWLASRKVDRWSQE